MTQQLVCPKCAAPRREGAKFCSSCRTKFESFMPETNTPHSDLTNMVEGVVDGVIDGIVNIVKKGSEKLGPKQNSRGAVTTPVRSDGIIPKKPGEIIGNHVIKEVYELRRSNYYKTFLVECSCDFPKPDLSSHSCLDCGKRYDIYLIHEVRRMGGNPPSLVRKDIPGFLKQLSRFDDVSNTGIQYLVIEHPGKVIKSLSKISQPMLDTKWILDNAILLGDALLELYRENYIPVEPVSFLQDVLESVIIIDGQRLGFTELTIFAPVNNNSAASTKLDQFYIEALGKIIYTLASGKQDNMRQVNPDLKEIPSSLKQPIEQARRKAGGLSFPDYLNKLKMILDAPDFTRSSLRQMAGWLTDVGRQRDHNEDTVGKYSLSQGQRADAPEVGLYLVADGMGGHQAGEKASSDVVLGILEKFTSERLQKLESVPRLTKTTVKLDETMTPGGILKEAILEVNKHLLQTRQQIASDRGTTITAALVIGRSCAIANVGDSRTYLLRQGILEQVTQDHSLVANLVKAKMIAPEDARNHPNRNQIFRTLGDKANVEVDIFDRELMPGDRLLLCSDGLWEMVFDSEIREILQSAKSPQAACDQLIYAANRNGGEDNISAIVVWIE